VISMFDALMAVAFMSVVFSLAAAILLVVDRLSLRSGLSEEERRVAVANRTERWQRRWNFFVFIMALLALFVNAFNLGRESIVLRVIWFVIAAFIVLGYLSRHRGHDKD